MSLDRFGFGALLLVSAAASSTVHAPVCNSTSFAGHTCRLGMTNISSAAVTNAAQCIQACCAANFTCNVAQWCAAGADCPTPGCYGGNEHAQPSCPRSAGWDTHLVNWAPAPPVPPPPAAPTPPPAPPPQPAFSFAQVVGSGMVLAAAPKQVPTLSPPDVICRSVPKRFSTSLQLTTYQSSTH